MFNEEAYQEYLKTLPAEVQEEMRKRDIVNKASSAIKPSIWFVGSIQDKAKYASDNELVQLTKLSEKTNQLKAEAWKIDKEISAILETINTR